MSMLTPQNVQLHPTRRMVVPNDRGVKTIFKYTAEIYREQRSRPQVGDS